MNRPKHWILGLGLVLAFAMTLGLPGASQAQQNDPAASYGPDYNSGHYGAHCRGYSYCPMGPGHGYSAPANQDSRQYVTRSKKVNRNARGSWNSGYARSHRGGWGCW